MSGFRLIPEAKDEPPCPKCGNAHIIGPDYEAATSFTGAGYGSHGERLRYQCTACGYRYYKRTLDASKEEP